MSDVEIVFTNGDIKHVDSQHFFREGEGVFISRSGARDFYPYSAIFRVTRYDAVTESLGEPDRDYVQRSSSEYVGHTNGYDYIRETVMDHGNEYPHYHSEDGHSWWVEF